MSAPDKRRSSSVIGASADSGTVEHVLVAFGGANKVRKAESAAIKKVSMDEMTIDEFESAERGLHCAVGGNEAIDCFGCKGSP